MLLEMENFECQLAIIPQLRALYCNVERNSTFSSHSDVE